MPRILKNIRPLYLLALFQLVGGPVVLLAVMMLGKLSAPNVVEHGVVAGITKTLQSGEWQSVTDTLLRDEVTLPGTAKEKVPAKNKGKETKGKLFVTDMARPVMAPVSEVIGIVPCARGDVFGTVRAQAPPGPPPRVA